MISTLTLACDENIGTGVPQALTLVGYDARSFVNLGWAGKPDMQWLSWLGECKWLLLSCNKKMLLVPDERAAIIQHRIGIVFLTSGQEYPHKVLELLLRKMHVLELLWNHTERPFARFLSIDGRPLSSKFKHYQL